MKYLKKIDEVFGWSKSERAEKSNRERTEEDQRRGRMFKSIDDDVKGCVQSSKSKIPEYDNIVADVSNLTNIKHIKKLDKEYYDAFEIIFNNNDRYVVKSDTLYDQGGEIVTIIKKGTPDIIIIMNGETDGGKLIKKITLHYESIWGKSEEED